MNIWLTIFTVTFVCISTAETLAAADEIKSWTEPETGMEFVFVKGGCFQMGDIFGDGGSESRPPHEVCVNDFFLGKYEVTQEQWQQIMGVDIEQQKNNAEASATLYGKGNDYPAYYVSWEDAGKFTLLLAQKAGKNFRLPSEAEWEYAARSGGKKHLYAGGDSLDAVGWHRENSGGKAHAVGLKQPNGLGVYDMTGNVLEWTLDWYDERYYGKSPRLNPRGPSFGKDRVHRGGSWDRTPERNTTIFRGCNYPQHAQADMGLRVLLPAEEIVN